MAWVYLASNKDGPLFNWNTHTGHRHGPHIWVIGGRLFSRGQDGNTALWHSAKASNTKPKLNAWNRLAVSFIYETGEFGLYVNGNVVWYQIKERRQQMQPTYGDIAIGNR